MARLAKNRRHRPRLPGKIQSLSSLVRQSFSSSVPLRRAQRPPGRDGPASRGLALEQPGSAQRATLSNPAGRLAGRSAWRLGRPGPARRNRRNVRLATGFVSKCAVWSCGLARSDREPARVGPCLGDNWSFANPENGNLSFRSTAKRLPRSCQKCFGTSRQ